MSKDTANQHVGLLSAVNALCEGCADVPVLVSLMRVAATRILKQGADYYTFNVLHPESGALEVTLSVVEFDPDE